MAANLFIYFINLHAAQSRRLWAAKGLEGKDMFLQTGSAKDQATGMVENCGWSGVRTASIIDGH